MTKAEQIMRLYDGARSTSEIAEIVGCKPEYVRVVARQRRGSGSSEIDRRYRRSSLGRLTQKRSNKKIGHHLKQTLAAYRDAVYQTGDRNQARQQSALAYKKAREMGASVKEATRIRSRRYQQVMRLTANVEVCRAASRMAYRASINGQEARSV